jgi:hypothetical protein
MFSNFPEGFKKVDNSTNSIHLCRLHAKLLHLMTWRPTLFATNFPTRFDTDFSLFYRGLPVGVASQRKAPDTNQASLNHRVRCSHLRNPGVKACSFQLGVALGGTDYRMNIFHHLNEKNLYWALSTHMRNT